MADGHSRTPGDALSGSLSDGRWAAGLARAGSWSDWPVASDAPPRAAVHDRDPQGRPAGCPPCLRTPVQHVSGLDSLAGSADSAARAGWPQGRVPGCAQPGPQCSRFLPDDPGTPDRGSRRVHHVSERLSTMCPVWTHGQGEGGFGSEGGVAARAGPRLRAAWATPRSLGHMASASCPMTRARWICGSRRRCPPCLRTPVHHVPGLD